MDEINEAVVRDFWARKARGSDNRWTSPEMFAWEVDLLRPLLPHRPASILDLGCGFGGLARQVRRPADRLVGVDQEAEYAWSFTATEEEFVLGPAQDFRSDERFDLVLLFGVVTYASPRVERALYEVCRRQGRVAVIKNQCALGPEKVINEYSQDLSSEYSARYPNCNEQLTSIRQYFREVEVVVYPQRFQRWPDTSHTAFIARV